MRNKEMICECGHKRKEHTVSKAMNESWCNYLKDPTAEWKSYKWHSDCTCKKWQPCNLRYLESVL